MGYKVTIEGFTRTGFRVSFVHDVNHLDDIGAATSKLGLLPMPLEKPDEHTFGRISHIAVTHTEDGTPHVAFFHENEKLESRWTHKYLNKPQEVAEFEAWAGIKIEGCLAKEGNAHPVRNKPSDAKYLVALPSVKALIRLTTYEKVNENGQDVWQASHDVLKYLGAAAAPAVVPVPVPAVVKHWTEIEAETAKVDEWIKKALEAKQAAYSYSLAEGLVRKDYENGFSYCQALKQLADEWEAAQVVGEDIPF